MSVTYFKYALPRNLAFLVLHKTIYAHLSGVIFLHAWLATFARKYDLYTVVILKLLCSSFCLMDSPGGTPTGRNLRRVFFC